jgi:hypothetical protein
LVARARELGGRSHVQGDGRPRILISSKCVNLIHEVMVYDSEVKENDHAVDALRYSLAKLKQYAPLRAFRFG